MSEKLFFGGMPTEPDIKKLRGTYPESTMKVGDVFDYKDVAAVIDSPYGSNRFRTVTERWRRVVEKQSGLFIGVIDGEAFKVLSEQEKFELARTKHGTVVSGIRRVFVVLGSTDRAMLTSDEDKKNYDFLKSRNSGLIASAQIRSHQKMLPEV